MGAGLCPCHPGGLFLCVSIFILPILEASSTLLQCHKQMTQFLVSQRAGGASWTKDTRKAEKELDMFGLVTSDSLGRVCTWISTLESLLGV